MNIDELRKGIIQNNLKNPDVPKCIFPHCPNAIDKSWDNDVLCREHRLLFLYWFYEENGWIYCPETYDIFTGKKEPKSEGSDVDMNAYRKRYCDWIASLSSEQYLLNLKRQIGDDSP